MEGEPPILDSHVYRDSEKGSWHRRTWYKGVHESLGEVEYGPEGLQTVVDRVVIKPILTFEVREPSFDNIQKRLLYRLIDSKILLSQTDETDPRHEQALEGIATVHDELRGIHNGNSGNINALFDWHADQAIERMQRAQK